MGRGENHMPGFNQVSGERKLVIMFLYFKLVHCLPSLHYFNYKQLQSSAQVIHIPGGLAQSPRA